MVAAFSQLFLMDFILTNYDVIRGSGDFIFKNSAFRNHIRTISLLNQLAHSEDGWLFSALGTVSGFTLSRSYPEAMKAYLNGLLA